MNYYLVLILIFECDNGNIKVLFSCVNDKNLEEKFIIIFEFVFGVVCNF